MVPTMLVIRIATLPLKPMASALVVCGPALVRSAILALGTAPVTNPALRTYGTLGRNAFRGPTRTNVNLTLAKITPIWGERLQSELRADFFNMLNHTQFDNPSRNITSPLFGQISSTGDPRIIQLAFRLTF